MTVYFLRHASAGEKAKTPSRDEKRALDRTGIEQCVRVGRVLAALDTHVDAILTSPLKRATQTAALVGNEIGYNGKLEMDVALRPEATYAAFQEMLQKRSQADTVMVVGHNPNLAQFLGRLVAQHGRPAHVELRKCGLAKVEIERPAATLQWLLTPKLARALATVK